MQSFLELHKRPVVQFDPSNPEHRRQVALFIKEGTWGKCPWAFYAPDNLSIKAYAMQTLVDYYLAKEFVAPVEETKTAQRKKSKSVSGGKLIAIQGKK